MIIGKLKLVRHSALSKALCESVRFVDQAGKFLAELSRDVPDERSDVIELTISCLREHGNLTALDEDGLATGRQADGALRYRKAELRECARDFRFDFPRSVIGATELSRKSGITTPLEDLSAAVKAKAIEWASDGNFEDAINLKLICEHFEYHGRRFKGKGSRPLKTAAGMRSAFTKGCLVNVLNDGDFRNVLGATAKMVRP